MKLKTLLLPVAALALCANAFAAPPSDASLERWIELQRFDEDFRQAFDSSFRASVQPFIDKMIAGIPAEKQARVVAAWTRYLDKGKDGILTPEMMGKW